MSIEIENVGEWITRDVVHYLVSNELTTRQEALALCVVYQNQSKVIFDLGWWEVLGLAMKQTEYLYQFWKERAERVNVKPQSKLEHRVVPGLVSVPEPMKPLSADDPFVKLLRALSEIR